MTRKKHRRATSVLIDAERFRKFFWLRRMTLDSVGPLVGRDVSWASVMASRGRAGLWTLDQLAIELSMHLDQLIYEIGTDEERERVYLSPSHIDF